MPTGGRALGAYAAVRCLRPVRLRELRSGACHSRRQHWNKLTVLPLELIGSCPGVLAGAVELHATLNTGKGAAMQCGDELGVVQAVVLRDRLLHYLTD